MTNSSSFNLPNRTSADDLIKLSRAIVQELRLESVFTNERAMRFVLSAASALGLVDNSGKVTSGGEALALARSPEDTAKALQEPILTFKPYDDLLKAVRLEKMSTTTLDWIVTKFSTFKVGTSSTNRTEGASTFAGLMDYLGIGKYIRGRKGGESRIEWDNDKLEGWLAAPVEPAYSEEPVSTPTPSTRKGVASGPERDGAVVSEIGHLEIPLTSAILKISYPKTASADDKKKIEGVLDLVKDLVGLEPQPQAVARVEVKAEGPRAIGGTVLEKVQGEEQSSP